MLGAGNRVIIKPSEFTPACGKQLKEMLNATFPKDLVDVVLGGSALGIEFSKVRLSLHRFSTSWLTYCYRSNGITSSTPSVVSLPPCRLNEVAESLFVRRDLPPSVNS